MKEKKQMEETNTGAIAAGFILAEVDGKLKLVDSVEGLVEGTAVTTPETLADMDLPALGDLYGKLVGQPAKTFKDKEIAVQSIVYQIAKKKAASSGAVAGAPAVGGGTKTAAKGPAVPKAPRAPKATAGLTLMVPKNKDAAFAKLPPQAKTVALILLAAAEQKGSLELTGPEVEALMSGNGVVKLLNTCQEPMRILAYYRGRLEEAGLIMASPLFPSATTAPATVATPVAAPVAEVPVA